MSNQPSVEKTTFILQDADGEDHTYDVTPHTGGDHMLVVKLAAVAGEPLGRLLQGNLVTLFDVFMSGAKEATEDAKSKEEAADQVKQTILDKEHDIRGVLESLDLDLSSVVKDVRNALFEVGTEELFRELFKNASRDGKPLSASKHYDEAWKRNWTEWTLAMWKIVQYNRFVPFLSTFLGS